VFGHLCGAKIRPGPLAWNWRVEDLDSFHCRLAVRAEDQKVRPQESLDGLSEAQVLWDAGHAEAQPGFKDRSGRPGLRMSPPAPGC